MVGKTPARVALGPGYSSFHPSPQRKPAETTSMPKQTKSNVAKSEPIVAAAVPVVEPAVPVVEPAVAAAPAKKRQARVKASDIVKQAAAQHILMHAKRPATDYIYFCQETRAKIMRENPTFTFKQVGQEQGRLWKALPDEAKAVYR